MAAFTQKEIDENPSIWGLFQNGGVVLFHKRATLASATQELTRAGYQVREIECKTHIDEESLLKAIVDSLGIERYPRMGLDGFNDFISQIDFGNHTGVVVALTAFHGFREMHPDTAFHILDIMADNHRSHLLLGSRLLTIVQSDDARIDEKLGTVGGYKPTWNPAEWFNTHRGL